MRQLKKIVFLLLLAMVLTSAPAVVQAAGTQNVQTATVKSGLRKENGKYYYYVKGKKLVSSWKNITQNGVVYRYYFGAKGAAYAGTRANNHNHNVLRKIGNYLYGFDYKGHMLKGVQPIYQSYQYKLYFFNKKNGRMNKLESRELQRLSTVKFTSKGAEYPPYAKLRTKLKALGAAEKKVRFESGSCFADGWDGTVQFATFNINVFKYRSTRVSIVMDVESR